jgi:hypothetical protein
MALVQDDRQRQATDSNDPSHFEVLAGIRGHD